MTLLSPSIILLEECKKEVSIAKIESPMMSEDMCRRS